MLSSHNLLQLNILASKMYDHALFSSLHLGQIGLFLALSSIQDLWQQCKHGKASRVFSQPQSFRQIPQNLNISRSINIFIFWDSFDPCLDWRGLGQEKRGLSNSLGQSMSQTSLAKRVAPDLLGRIGSMRKIGSSGLGPIPHLAYFHSINYFQPKGFGASLKTLSSFCQSPLLSIKNNSIIRIATTIIISMNPDPSLKKMHYIETKIDPILSRLVVDVLTKQPDDPVEFMIKWLQERKDFFKKTKDGRSGTGDSALKLQGQEPNTK